MNWQEQLGAFLRDNPDLPEGPDTPSEPEAADTASEAARHPRLDISIQRKGRAGKTVTVISGFRLPSERILRIASQIKSRLGAGGSAESDCILIQGDRRNQVGRLLSEIGFRNRIV